MGKFLFEQQLRVDFDDRVLAHLQIVITTKLRRAESFTFSWRDDASIGDGRTSIWIHPASVMVFKFSGSRPPRVNRAWLEALSFTANGPQGLYVVPEPAPVGPEKDSVDEAY